MKRAKGELTPKQVANLRAKFPDGYRGRLLFRRALAELGYYDINYDGMFREVMALPKGKYVIKYGYGAHCSGNRMRKRYLKNPKLFLPVLAWGKDFCVQRRVDECHCATREVSRLHWDAAGHNHTHEGGRIRVFDY